MLSNLFLLVDCTLMPLLPVSVATFISPLQHFHTISDDLSRKFSKDGMLAYVHEIQDKEREIGCDVLTHQKWYVIHLHLYLFVFNSLLNICALFPR
jgi:hypothetical protein